MDVGSNEVGSAVKKGVEAFEREDAARVWGCTRGAIGSIFKARLGNLSSDVLCEVADGFFSGVDASC